MKFGYVRATKWKPEKMQLEILNNHGVDARRIYVDGRDGESLDEVIKALRAGSELVVAMACRLVNDRRLLKAVIEKIHSKDAIVIDATTGHKSDGFEFPLDAIAGIANDRYHFSYADAKRIGKTGGRPAITPPMSKEDALKIWYDDTLRSKDAAAKIGVTESYAYRWLKKRGVVAGRPLVDRSGTQIPADMVVYFVRSGRSGPVKIGTTANLKGRLSALSHPLVDNLILLGTVDGGRGKEAEMHKRFKKYRLKGEWFKYEGDLAKFIESLPKPKKL